MKVDEIKLMNEYNDWADERVLAACAKVSTEQYYAPSPFEVGRRGLHETMVHMLDNVWQWRITLQGYYEEPLADEAAYDATELHEDAIPTFDALRERWTTEKGEMRAYIAALDEETLNGVIRYVIPGAVREYVVWQLLWGAYIIHAMEHRSEAVTMLSFYGQPPGNIDFPIFMAERASKNA
jgi:uncharacterized damage-inducible protein DinB